MFRKSGPRNGLQKGGDLSLRAMIQGKEGRNAQRFRDWGLGPANKTALTQRIAKHDVSSPTGRCWAGGRREMRKESGRITETPVEARAGFLDRPVLVVLILSTLAVIAAFALIYTGHLGWM